MTMDVLAAIRGLFSPGSSNVAGVGSGEADGAAGVDFAALMNVAGEKMPSATTGAPLTAATPVSADWADGRGGVEAGIALFAEVAAAAGSMAKALSPAVPADEGAPPPDVMPGVVRAPAPLRMVETAKSVEPDAPASEEETPAADILPRWVNAKSRVIKAEPVATKPARGALAPGDEPKDEDEGEPVADTERSRDANLSIDTAATQVTIIEGQSAAGGLPLPRPVEIVATSAAQSTAGDASAAVRGLTLGAAANEPTMDRRTNATPHPLLGDQSARSARTAAQVPTDAPEAAPAGFAVAATPSQARPIGGATDLLQMLANGPGLMHAREADVAMVAQTSVTGKDVGKERGISPLAPLPGTPVDRTSTTVPGMDTVPSTEPTADARSMDVPADVASVDAAVSAPVIARAEVAPVSTAAATLIQPSTPDLSASLGQQVIDIGVSGQWIDGLAREIATLAAGDGQGSFRLSPEHLGPMRVDVRNGEQGAEVRLTVETEAAERVLSQDADRLKSDARHAAVRIADVIVERSHPVAETARGDTGSQSQNGSQSPAQSQSAQGNQAGMAQGQGGQSQPQPERKNFGGEAVLNHGERKDQNVERDDPSHARRARYA